MKHLISLIFIFLARLLAGQNFLNGSFENNAAGNIDQINLSNVDCNAKLRDVNSFGSYGDVDIISSPAYGGSGAQHGTWYLGMTGGSTDIIALSLSSPLLKGQSYSISFYDRKTAGYEVSPVQFGLSDANNTTGTIIYTSQELATLNTWTQHTFTFAAPYNGRFITVQMAAGTLSDWINIDNFVLNPVKCGGILNITASSGSVTKGEPVTFTVSGGGNYIWSPVETLVSLREDAVTTTPKANTIYTVTSHLEGCPVLTATVAIQVKKILAEIPKDSIPEKPKDTVREEKPLEAAHAKSRKRLFHTHRVNGRRFIIQESLVVSNNTVKVLVWDKNRVDGDQVSLYLNGQLVVENFTVTKTKKEMTLNLEPGKNIIVMYALNLGLIPPNTSALSLNDGSRAKIITLVSDLKRSGALEVIYDPVAFKYK